MLHSIWLTPSWVCMISAQINIMAVNRCTLTRGDRTRGLTELWRPPALHVVGKHSNIILPSLEQTHAHTTGLKLVLSSAAVKLYYWILLTNIKWNFQVLFNKLCNANFDKCSFSLPNLYLIQLYLHPTRDPDPLYHITATTPEGWQLINAWLVSTDGNNTFPISPRQLCCSAVLIWAKSLTFEKNN